VKLYVGASGYAYKEWKGEFYPEKLSSARMLGFYSERLDTVEINNTFYRMPTEKVLTSWANQVPEGFVFALKAPQRITHIKRLRDIDEETDYLFATLAALGDKLGPVLFQFPTSFRKDLPALKGLLDLLPPYALCAFAFRSKSWLDDETLELLRHNHCGLCIEDTDEAPVDAITSTTSWGYLRLRGSDYTESDLSRWSAMVLSQPWDKAFVFFKHETQALAPKLAMRFREISQ